MKPTLLVLVVLVLLTLFSSCKFSRKLLYYPDTISPARQQFLQENYPLLTRLTIPVGQDIRLRGWLIEKDLAALPTIFYFGGNGEEVSLNIEMMERELAANVVLVNYRGYGQSDGVPREKALKADALTIYDYILTNYPVRPDSVIAAGRSLGTGVAAWLAWKKEIPRLILVSPFDGIDRVAANHFPGWLVWLTLGDKYRTIDFADQITSKTLVIASENDEVVPVKHSRRLYESLTCDKQMVNVNTAGHNDFEMFAAYWQAWRKMTAEKSLQ